MPQKVIRNNLQSPPQVYVIIFAPCILSNRRDRASRVKVALENQQQTLSVGEEGVRMGAQIGALSKVVHVSMLAFGEPFEEALVGLYEKG